MGKLTHKRSLILYALAFIGLLAGALLWNAPLNAVNRLLPENTQLLNTNGDIHHGRWQDIQIDGKPYPLACHYQRLSLTLSAATYQLNCDTPFTLESTATIGFNGDIHLTNTLINGEIASASAWLRLLGIPSNLSGEIGINLAQATIADNTLTHLAVSGGVQHIALFNMPIVQQVRINTLNPELSPNQPIQLEIRTPKADTNNAQTEKVRLYLNSDIDGKNYRTSGEISGKLLGNYATILRFFGQQIGPNTFAVQMQGRLLP